VIPIRSDMDILEDVQGLQQLATSCRAIARI